MAVLGDPESFPITADQPRDPLNWYGRTKAISEQAIKKFADGAFPAHLFLKSNLYGEHVIEGTSVGKPTVINFFVDRARSGDTLTVYDPGSQARNFIHVKDVARVYVRSAERLIDQLNSRKTGIETYEIASDEDLSVMRLAEIVQERAKAQRDISVDIDLVENPRSGEAMVETFSVDTSKAQEQLGWETTHDISESIQSLLE
jgi:UDP-glucose 4-epimerase